MSLLHQTASLALSAIFLAPSLGCVVDGAPVDDDRSDQALALEGVPGEIEANAVADINGEFLLSFVVDLFPTTDIRLIGAVEFTPVGEGGTANFSFQPINAPECVPDAGGLPVAVDPFVVDGVPINAAGTST